MKTIITTEIEQEPKFKWKPGDLVEHRGIRGVFGMVVSNRVVHVCGYTTKSCHQTKVFWISDYAREATFISYNFGPSGVWSSDFGRRVPYSLINSFEWLDSGLIHKAHRCSFAEWAKKIEDAEQKRKGINVNDKI